MKLKQFVHLVNSFNPIDFEKSRIVSNGIVAIFKLKICISRLRDKVYIFGWILVQLTQFVHLIRSSNAINFEKNWAISDGKSSHINLKICISCLEDKVYIFSWNFMKLRRFIHLINSSKPIDFEKNQTISMGKVAILSRKICISCLHDTVCICGQIFVKVAQFVYIINSLNPVDFEKHQTMSKRKVAILS